ncbi:MAG: ABC transporter ATP-binding protein [Thermoanaerobaculia bacterium]
MSGGEARAGARPRRKSSAGRRPAVRRPGAAPLLEVRDLSVRYSDRKPAVLALDRLSFEVAEGEAVGLLGESGCGKTSLALAIAGLLPPGGEIAGGAVRFRGRLLNTLGEDQLRRLRGAEIGFVFQQPSLALHPMKRARDQVAEVLRAHRGGTLGRWRPKADALLAEVGLTEDGFAKDRLAEAYPHQLSGGQRQRVVIAQALACRPALVLADEPTAALDATARNDVLALLRRLARQSRLASLTISHDPQVLAQAADRVLVMYGGRLVEEGPCERVLGDPRHPYTEALLACLPPLPGDGGRRSRKLPVVPGEAPPSADAVPGCCFAPRCAYRFERCDEEPGMYVDRDRRVWCFRYEES